ncbi:MAG: ABC transporter substrate-binding protein [Deltaproteobacteria bacterium]|nr:ABC transporter substrate-binding protein [Deltaproteobacteria bacterium]
MIRLFAFILLVFVAACSGSDSPAEDRAEQLRKSFGEILIGAAGPWSENQNLLWQGIEMAVDEINLAGGVLNRKIRVIKGDDECSVSKGQIVAQQFAENPNMVAVIGHSDSYVSLPTSIMYQYYGLLMLSPLSTSSKLTHQGFNRVFRNIPEDAIFGEKLAWFCRQKGFRRVMIYHSRNAYGDGLSNVFETKAEEFGITILDRMSYDLFSGSRQFQQDLKYWRSNYEFDAIFLAGVIPQAAEFVAVARNLGITQPIVGGDGLDDSKLLEIAGPAAEGVYAGSVFDSNDPCPVVQAFCRAFRTRYAKDPDIAAAQGYDAVKVLAFGIEKAGSVIPDRIAATLRNLDRFSGLTGAYRFDEHGDVVGRPLVMKLVRNGRFEYAGQFGSGSG